MSGQSKNTKEADSMEQKKTGSGIWTPAKIGATSVSVTPFFLASHRRAELAAANADVIVSPVTVSYVINEMIC